MTDHTMPTVRATDMFSDASFPLHAMRIGSHHASALHGHEFHELVLIEAGRGRHLLEAESYPIAAGDAFLIKGSNMHAYADVEGLALVNLLFDPDLLDLSLADLRHLPGYHVLFHVEPELRRPGSAGRLRLGPVQLDEASSLVTGMIGELTRRRPGYRFMATAMLKLLIGYLARWGSEDVPAANSNPLLRMGELLSFIDRHYDDPITVADMAARVAMSESTLLRTFRRVTGTSPTDYVLKTRLDKAARMLVQPGARVTDVAFACGFGDANYFSRVFRKRRGVTPRTFQRNSAASI